MIRKLPNLMCFVFCGLVVWGLALVPAWAQYKAGIQGTVEDTTGAVVAGAKVTVTNQETGKSQEVTTSQSGFYSVAGLPPGTYTVTASFTGFSEKVVKDFTVNAEQTMGLNLTIQPGEVKQSVTVTASAAPVLQTETATSSATLTTRQIDQLPQVGRDPYELLRLTPGVF
jgi:hypothetical protein